MDQKADFKSDGWAPGKSKHPRGATGSLAAIVSQVWPTIVVAALLVGLIQLGHLSLPPYLFPSALAVGQAVVEAFTVDASDIFISLFRFIVALSTATLCGWLLGLLMGAFRKSVSRILKPIFSILQAVPALSWVLLSVLWISEVEIRIWFICFMIGLPFYAIAVYEGIRDIDSELVEAIDQFRPNRWQVLVMLLIPQSLVYLLISMRSVSSLILRILVFAELIGASSGIGEAMGAAQTNFRMDMIFAWTIVMVLFNFLLMGGIDLLERHLLSWRKEVAVR